MSLTLEYSAWWLWLIAAVSAAVVWLLYFHKSKQSDWNPALKFGLATLRFALIFTMAFLLLKPFFIHDNDHLEKPKLVFYSDVSASVNKGDKAKADETYQQARALLSEKYDLVKMHFGAQAHFAEDSGALDSLYTDLGAVASSLSEDFYGENVAAAIVATDGIQTRGTDPRYVNSNNNAKVYALMLGDTGTRADIELKQVLNNRLAFLNNDIEFKARINARKLSGNQMTVRLLKDDKVVDEKRSPITNDQWSVELSFITRAQSVGLNKYTVEVDLLDDEVNALNNSAEAFIDVLDNRTSIKMIAKAPHPDIAAIKRAIEKSDQYEVDVVLFKDWDGLTHKADLVMLHGLPTNANELNRLKVISNEGIPQFAILTKGVSLIHFNALEMGLEIESNGSKSDEVGATVNGNFNLFNSGAHEKLKRFPPLVVPFGKYRPTGEHQVALFQRIGNINTDIPLWIFSVQNGVKHAVLSGEGWWRWRLFEASLGENEVWTENLLQKAVQYLAIKQKRTRINVVPPKRLQEGEEVVFDAEYYNEAFELNNEPEMQLEVTDSAGNTLNFRMRKFASAYRVTLGTLPAGDYNWRAHCTVNGSLHEAKGVFTVAENRAEYINLVADHNLLRDWSSRTGGSAFLHSESESLLNVLLSLDSAKPIVRTSREWLSLIEWKLLLFLLVALATVEWFIRKYTGYV